MIQFPNPAQPSGQNTGLSDIIDLTPDDILLYKNIQPSIVQSINDAGFFNQSIYDLMLRMGSAETTTTTENYHYETGSYFAYATVDTVTSASAGSAQLNFNTTSVYGSAGNYTSPFQVNDILLINGRYQVIVTQKVAPAATQSGHYVVVSRGSDTDFALNSTSIVTSGAVLSSPFSIQTAYGAFPDGITIRDVRYKTPLMRMQTGTGEVTADLANQETYISLPGVAGSNYRIPRIKVALTIRHALKKSMALIVGKAVDYTLTQINSGTKTETSTSGLWPTIQQFGTTRPIASGMLDLYDLYEIAQVARSTGQSPEMMGLFGSQRKVEFDAIFKNAFPNGAYVWNAKSDMFAGAGTPSPLSASEAQQKGVNLGFNGVVVNDVTIHAKAVSEFDHPNIFNAPGLRYSWYRMSAAFLPAMTSGTFNGSPVTGTSFKVLTRPGYDGNNWFDAPNKAQIQTINRGPSNIGAQAADQTLSEEFALTTYNASKCQLVTL